MPVERKRTEVIDFMWKGGYLLSLQPFAWWKKPSMSRVSAQASALRLGLDQRLGHKLAPWP